MICAVCIASAEGAPDNAITIIGGAAVCSTHVPYAIQEFESDREKLIRVARRARRVPR